RVSGLTAVVDVRIVVTTVGLAVVVVALVLSRQRLLDEAFLIAPGRSLRGVRSVAGEVRLLLTPPLLMAFAYFVLVAASMSAVSTFSVAALVAIYEMPLTLAAGALTAYLLGGAAGLVRRGLLAARVRRHAVFAAAGMAI